MIALGMALQVDRDGATVPVESLRVGDSIYDPVADCARTVTDILERTSATLGGRMIRTEPGALGRCRPCSDLLSCPMQPILCIDRTTARGRYPVMEARPARELGSEVEMDVPIYALVLDGQGFAAVNGAVLRFAGAAEAI